MRRLYRKTGAIIKSLRSHLRVINLRLKYAGTDIRNTRIHKNCKIVCTRGSKLIIHDSHIKEGTFLMSDNSGLLSIKQSFVGRNCLILAKDEIKISSQCLIAEFVVIRDHDHNFELSDKVTADLGHSTAPVLIESNVWLGAKSSVFKGVKIGKNSVVGAHSLVIHNVDSNSLYVGSPARKIRSKDGA